MANRTLVELQETNKTGQSLGFRTEIQRSAAGQPGIFVTNYISKNGQDIDQLTVDLDDGMTLIAPVLSWLLTEELVNQVAEQNYIRSGYTLDPETQQHLPWEQCSPAFRQICKNQARLTLESLVAVGQQRL